MQEVRLRRQGGRLHELPPHPPLPQERHQRSHQVEERYADVSSRLWNINSNKTFRNTINFRR
jgi:hypothetical protein